MKNKLPNVFSAILFVSTLALSLNSCSDADGITPSSWSASLTNFEPQNDPPTDICPCLDAAFDLEPLSELEKNHLLFMREEEKLARDVYLTFYDQYGLKVFNNIAQAEGKHMEAVLCLLNRYELEDPSIEKEVGEFVNSDLQSLYNELVGKGRVGLEDALAVGAWIEEVDIDDLTSSLENDIDNADVKAVFENLYRGSRNHLRAFVKNLSNRDMDYLPQVLDKTDFEAIIQSDQEQGSGLGGQCAHQGKGKGNGRKGGKNKGSGQGDCDGKGQGRGH